MARPRPNPRGPKRSAGQPRPAPKASSARTKAKSAKPEAEPAHPGPRQTIALRDLFWDNVVRDMLNSLSVLSQQQPDQFDGRFAVLTKGGERIPIAQVFPIFACSIPGTKTERETSTIVQCTVFRIVTPSGEVFTLPVHEIRAMHTLSRELIEQLQHAAEEQEAGESAETTEADGRRKTGEERPFGFAAYTSLPKLPPMPASDDPLE